MARFAPLAGKQASIVDELGIHFVDIDACQESLFINAPNIDALNYSSADNFVVACEKFNPNFADNKNLRIIDTKTGRSVAEFVWRMSAKEGLRTIKWSPDESFCFRMVPPAGQNQPNSIEVYRNREFSAPANVIHAKFPKKGKNKKDPPIVINGRFDGLELCPLNPAVSPEQSPQYLFAW